MKVKAIAVAAGVSAPLILTGSAPAGFTGITTVSKPNEFGIFVVNVYAEFDRPGEDHMLAIAGTPAAPLNISVVDGTFFQNIYGTDTAPNPALFEIFPSLRYDSFVTIGVKSFNPADPGIPEGSLEDYTSLKPGWPGFGESTLTFTDNAWFITPLDAQGDPFDPGAFPGNGKVLIGQFATEDGVGFEGTMLLHFFSNGAPEIIVVSFQHMQAQPCPWDCEGFSDGVVGITDFLALLAQWGLTDTSCDFDGGGVGITDFLELLANWGPCP